MKTITFRPLRLVKKTGKIVVASYMQWNRLFTTDFRGEFALTIADEYRSMPPDAYVYNHEGKPLFWRDFDPASIPVFTWTPFWYEDQTLKAIREAHPDGYALLWQHDGRVNYSHRNLDCNGVPPFSHYTIDYVAEHLKNYTEFEPLTVGQVVKWLGWLLLQLENSRLQIGK